MEVYQKVYKAWCKFLAEKTSQRHGQAAYNTLYSLYPELAREVVNTDKDPFYNDRLLPEFWGWLAVRSMQDLCKKEKDNV